MAIHIETVHEHLHIKANIMRRLKQLSEHILQAHGFGEWSVSMTFVNDHYIQQLNRAYLKKDHPTDVLAFPIDDPGHPNAGVEKILGDIYVSLDRAQEQGVEYEASFPRIRDKPVAVQRFPAALAGQPCGQ